MARSGGSTTGIVEEIYGCIFRRDDLYSLEDMLWFRRLPSGTLLAGLLHLTQALWGKISVIRPKPPCTLVEEGRALFFVEARRYVGNVRSPFRVRVLKVNPEAEKRPWAMQRGPDEDSWVCEVALEEPGHLARLKGWDRVREEVRRLIGERGVVCFREVPDYVHAAVGIECSQLLMVLADRLEGLPEGALIHVLADYNPGAEKDLEKWSLVTGNEVVDFRVEGRLAHALIRKKTPGLD